MEPIQFTSTVQDFHNSLWGLHIPVPESIALLLTQDQNRRIICSLSNKESWQAALMPTKSYWYILLNKERAKRNGLKEGFQVTVSLIKDTSEYGMDIPEELQEVLWQDAAAQKWFDLLTPGKKRSLMYLVSTVKNTDSRIRKSLAIAHHLTKMSGKLDFKILSMDIKSFNNM